jgi:PHD/YefM family antitoxin component YafN of YafNO toxin-antitoxin module
MNKDTPGMKTTAYLLRSPKNAQRLLATLHRAVRQEGKLESLKQLRREVGLGTRSRTKKPHK